MDTCQIVIDVPVTVLLAEKTDEQSFARELRMLAAVKLYELARLASGRAAELAGVGYRVLNFYSTLNVIKCFRLKQSWKTWNVIIKAYFNLTKMHNLAHK